MKLIIYEVLTQLIIWLGRLRDVFSPRLVIRPDRICGTEYKEDPRQPEMNEVPFSRIACCDCGAKHFFWIERDIFFGMAFRPKGYKYRLRFGHYSVTLATKEMLNKTIAMRYQR